MRPAKILPSKNIRGETPDECMIRMAKEEVWLRAITQLGLMLISVALLLSCVVGALYA